MSIRLMSHNQWKCDHNSPAWETMGLDCSATPRMQGFAKAIDHILVRGGEDVFIKRFERFSPPYYLPLSDHSPVVVDGEM